MATVGTLLTLADWAKRQDPDGKHAQIIEILRQTEEMLDDAMFIEGNLPTGHRHTVRGGLPTPSWRLLNYGVPVTKSQTKQVDDACGMLEDYSEVDKALADLNGDTAAFRWGEDIAHIQGMSNTMASTMIYGNTASDPEKFLGLAPRYNSLSAENAGNIINAGGTGSDNTSIWLISWGLKRVFGIFPKGSKAGLQFSDKGQVTLDDTDGNHYEGYRSHYKWDAGFTVADWRYAVRICNIDVSDLTKDASGSSADLVDLMTQAIELLPDTNGKTAFYCNRTVRSFLRRQITRSDNVNISMSEVAGKKAVMFDEYPVRRVDSILNNEAKIA
jgi:hypothetical protein